MLSRSLVFSLLALSGLAAPTTTSAPTVTISNGVVIGKKTTVSNQPSNTAQANAFLGVPYAKPPVRFAPPVPAAPWSSPINAVNYKATCIQQIASSDRASAGGINAPTLVESEDCLYLNVWSPSNATSNSNLPVLFWLFGGNLQYGSGSLPAYDGTSFAVNQNVVVVTINYRTNIFGFSNSPEIAFGSQNSGFLDQRLALQWVQQNIAQFGGNPKSVMLFGESAGGESVKQILAQPPNPLPFSSAVTESEQSFFPGPGGAANYQNVLSHFNCKDLACIRGVDAVAIRRYIENGTSGELFFPPVADPTYVTDIRNNIHNHTFANVPILMGTNLNEGRILFAGIEQNNGTEAINEVLTTYNLNSTFGQQLVSFYANATNQSTMALVDVADRVGTDLVFTCTTGNIAEELSRYGYMVWRYSFDGAFPSVSPFPDARAYHTSEIYEVFGTYPLSNQYGKATTQQIQLSAFMQGVWAGFAQNPAVQPPWPRIGATFGQSPDQMGDLGLNGSSGVTVTDTFSHDYPCVLYGGIEDALGLSW